MSATTVAPAVALKHLVLRDLAYAETPDRRFYAVRLNHYAWMLVDRDGQFVIVERTTVEDCDRLLNYWVPAVAA